MCSLHFPFFIPPKCKLFILLWFTKNISAIYCICQGGVEILCFQLLSRFPKSLHKRLSQEAKKEGVSLNSFIQHLISYALGCRDNDLLRMSKHLYIVPTVISEDLKISEDTGVRKTKT
ncbi:toxin-antitoxin system HicB family antitoxin [Caldicellulosiruptor hydrothermalis]|uniref:toxin-antitoxin system HicB family antitoxin n=1 Tax=Caldicellulosiruptor hydrothermalis TaxID=413888 RepID=UPI000A07A0A2|nr:toxin-antitoxin system HicB family antitoxin [Caldicellulosiruptor hydrothermalis]